MVKYIYIGTPIHFLLNEEKNIKNIYFNMINYLHRPNIIQFFIKKTHKADMNKFIKPTDEIEFMISLNNLCPFILHGPVVAY